MSEQTLNPFNRNSECLLWLATEWLIDINIIDEDTPSEWVHERGIIANIDNLYEGGWNAFVHDSADHEEWWEESRQADPLVGTVLFERSNFGNSRSRRVSP